MEGLLHEIGLIYIINYYFRLVHLDRLPQNVLQCDWRPCWCCLIFHVYPFVGAGTLDWVVEAAGHGVDSILQGLSC